MQRLICLLILLSLTSCSVLSKSSGSGKVCEEAGPQTPRDIASKAGSNPVDFAVAPHFNSMNLCNIHFHKNAEHKGPGFSVFAGEGESGGYACNKKQSLSSRQLRPVTSKTCKGIEVGDTVEVHWVHSSCDIEPGPTLGSCLADDCTDPVLKVETQVFLLVNDPRAASFLAYDYLDNSSGFHQARTLPKRNGKVEFLGSTTGPSYNNEQCSPYQVNWSVTPNCNLLDINSLHKWCEDNVFDEKKAHGVRELVTDERFLSKIK